MSVSHDTIGWSLVWRVQAVMLLMSGLLVLSRQPEVRGRC